MSASQHPWPTEAADGILKKATVGSSAYSSARTVVSSLAAAAGSSAAWEATRCLS